MQWGLTRLALQAARRTWRPKTLQNRGQNLKKWRSKNNMFADSILSWFRGGFGEVFERFFVCKNDPNRKTWNIENPYKTLAVRTEFQYRRIKKRRKINAEFDKNGMFFLASILDGFEVGFGRVLGGRNLPKSRPRPPQSYLRPPKSRSKP